MSLEQEFRISSEMADGALTIHVDGELDMATAPRLSEVLAAYVRVRVLTVDLSSCEFVDSSGIRELVVCRQQLGPNVPMTIVGVAPNVEKTFGLVGIAEVIHIDRADPSRD